MKVRYGANNSGGKDWITKRWQGGSASGEDCLTYLYKNVPKGLREACSGEKE